MSSSSSAAGSESSVHLFHNLSNLSLGYAIAIAFSFLLLLLIIFLAFYVCRRATRNSAPPPNPNPNPNPNGVILPRIIFVAEDDDDNAITGLDASVISSYPKFPYSSKDRSCGVGGDSVCSICLCDYRDGEMLRMLPDCRHLFHLSCIDAWLRLNTSCPVCRTSPLPTPMSTPLSELVPLSHFSADRRSVHLEGSTVCVLGHTWDQNQTISKVITFRMLERCTRITSFKDAGETMVVYGAVHELS